MRKRFLPAAIAAAILVVMPLARAKDDKWVEARSPNFIVVSNAGEQQARKTAVQFEQIREFFRRSLKVASEHPTPVITILAVKDENSLRELLPDYWAEKGHAHPAGIFIDSLYQFEVAIDLAEHGENPYETIYHEYYHSLTTPYFPRLPIWLAEGLAVFYGNSTINEKTAIFGSPDPALLALLQQQPLIPLPVLLKADHTSPYYNEKNKVSIFYAESWALVHYLMMGDGGVHRQTFTSYLAALSEGASEEEAASKGFGDLGKLQKMLQGYIGRSSFSQFSAPAPVRVAESEIQMRTLSDAEADAYRGGFLALHGQFKPAQPLLEQSARLDPKLALAHQNLAVLHYIQQQQADALADLLAAIQLDPKNALTRYLRAELTFNGGDASRGNPQIEEDLRQAIAVNPDFAPPYGLLALDLAAKNQSLPEALAFGKKGVSLQPGDSSYQLALAQVLARMHQYDQAEQVAIVARGNATDARGQAYADEVIDFVRRLKDADPRGNRSNSTVAASVTASPTVREPAADPDADQDEGQPKIIDNRPRAEGVVTDVRCKAYVLQITVATSRGPVALHAADFGKVNFIDTVPNESFAINPCTGLNGRNVRVIYLPSTDPVQPYQGEIRTVEIEK
jgi:tetratricopeptide (TPR) repeat protein